MKQLNVAISDETRAFLEAGAKENGRTLAGEVREMLERAAKESMMDPATFDVLNAVAHAGALVRAHFGWDWYEHPDAHAAFFAAVGSRIHRHTPKEKPSGKPPYSVEPIVVFPDGGPQTVGVAIEGVMHMDRLGIERGVQTEYMQRMWKKNRGRKPAAKKGEQT